MCRRYNKYPTGMGKYIGCFYPPAKFLLPWFLMKNTGNNIRQTKKNRSIVDGIFWYGT